MAVRQRGALCAWIDCEFAVVILICLLSRLLVVNSTACWLDLCTVHMLTVFIHPWHTRKNIVLEECECQYEICSSDYTQHTHPPVTATATRHLQHAMVPGAHLISVRLLCRDPAERETFTELAARVKLSTLDASKNTTTTATD